MTRPHQSLPSPEFATALPSYTSEYIGTLATWGLWVARSQNETVKLRNGDSSNVYVNHARIMTDPNLRSPFMNAITAYVGSHFDSSTVLANVDSKASAQITGTVAHSLGLRQIMTLSQAAAVTEGDMGRDVWLPRDLHENPPSNIVVIDDVAHDGREPLLSTIERVRDAFAKEYGFRPQPEMHGLVGVVRRHDETHQALQGQGAAFHHLTTLEHVLHRAWPYLSHQQQSMLAPQFPPPPEV